MQPHEPHELAYAHSAADGRDSRTLARMIVLLAMAVSLAEIIWAGGIYGRELLNMDPILTLGRGWRANLYYLGGFSKILGALGAMVCGGLIITNLYPRALPLAVAFGLLALGAWAILFVNVSYYLVGQGWMVAWEYAAPDAVELTVSTLLTLILFTSPIARAVRRGTKS